MFPDVSIIMPAYNQAKYLPESLNSVLAQTFTNWECIIIDDGSTDNCADVAAPFIETDKRLKYYRIQNGGPSNARNFGIQQATSDYILPLDADDKISPNYIEECFKIIKTSPTIKLVYGAGEKFGLINMPWALEKYNFKALLLNNCIHPCGMFRKTDWEAVGGYDINMTAGIEDWEFWINILSKDANVAMLNNITFYWRIKEVSRTTLLKKGNKIALMKRYIYYKHAELYNDLFADPIDLYYKYAQLQKTWDWTNKNSFKFFLSRIKRKLTGKHTY